METRPKVAVPSDSVDQQAQKVIVRVLPENVAQRPKILPVDAGHVLVTGGVAELDALHTADTEIGHVEVAFGSGASGQFGLKAANQIVRFHDDPEFWWDFVENLESGV